MTKALATAAEKPRSVAAVGMKRMTVALMVAGLVLLGVCTALGFGRVDVTLMGRQTSCGTGFAPGWSDDMLTGTVCEGLMQERHLSMLLAGLAGVALLLAAAAARRINHGAR